MKHRSLSCGTLVMIATSVLGFAQEEISAEELPRMVVELPKVIVSAPRFSDADIEVPARVQLIDRATIEDSETTDLVDLLSKEANLHFRSTSGNSALSKVSLGGFGENSDQRVLVLLDGHRLNTADLGPINWLSIPLSLVESIEVIKGGQSALYGNNAVGGVIKIKTVQSQEELTGQFQTSGGSFDSYNTRLGVSGKVGSLGVSAHAEHDETDGYRENSQYEADGGGVKFDWLVDDRFSSHISVSGVDSEYGLPGPLSRAEISADPKQSMEVENFGEEEALYYRGGIGFYLNEEFSFDLDVGHTERDLYSLLYFFGIPYEIEQDYEIFSVSPTLTYENDRLTAIVGLDHYDDQVDAVFGTDPVEYERQTLAAFTSLKYHLAEDLIVAASLRAERARTDGIYSGTDLDEVEEEQHAWSIGLVRKFDNHGRAYASARHFYRYPATDEILVYSPLLSFTPDLVPEWGYEVELGGDLALGSVVAGARVYNQWMHDEIIFNPDLGFFGENTNLDETSRYGADLFATWTLTDKTETRANYSYAHAEIDGGAFDGSEIPLVPEHKLRVAMEHRPSDSVRIVTGASYTDSVYIDFDNAESELSDYLLFDLSVRYAFSEDASAFVTVDNVFDKEYVSEAYGPDALYPGVGRSAKVGVTWRF